MKDLEFEETFLVPMNSMVAYHRSVITIVSVSMEASGKILVDFPAFPLDFPNNTFIHHFINMLYVKYELQWLSLIESWLEW